MSEITPYLLLAQDAAPPGGGGLGLMPAFVAIGILFYAMLIVPERRKQRAHRLLLDQLKKNDRVVTIGGMYGTVVNVQRDADEVTLKVDEATNTKVRVTFSAISRVITDAPADEKPAKS